MNMKKIIALLLAVVLVLGLSACTTDKSNTPDTTPNTTDKTQPSGTLVVGTVEMAGVFNPAYYATSYDGFVVDMIFEALVRLDFEGEIVPEIAKYWKISDDGKEITFDLLDDVKFSDGTPLTAKDVEFTYLVLADPSYTGRYGANVKDMRGYDEYFKGRTDKFEGIEVKDDYTIVFKFEESLRTNLENLTIGIMPKHYYGADFVAGNTQTVEKIVAEPMGSGPYKLTNFSPKEFAALTRNTEYYGSGYEIKDIVCKFVDPSTELTELMNNNVHLLAGAIETNKIATVKKSDTHTVNSYPRSGYGYISFNCESGPTADVKVRQALAHSFNIAEYIGSDFTDKETGEVLATSQFHPMSQVSWAIDDKVLSEMNNYEFDLAKSAALLEESGWKVNANNIREKDGKILELKIAAMPDNPILQTLIPMWERDWASIGVKLNIAFMEFNTLADYVETKSDENVKNWDVFFMAGAIDSADPHSAYSTYHSSHIGSGNSNYARYKNTKVDELFDEGKKIMDPEEAKPIYQEICKILNEELPTLPIYANTYFDLYNKNLTNFKTSSLYNWVSALRDAKITQ